MKRSVFATVTESYRKSFGPTFFNLFALGTAFTVSMLWKLGPEVLPLIDKGHLLVLLAFYTSALTVAARMLSGLLQIGVANAKDAVEGTIGRSIRKKLDSRSSSKTYSKDQIARLAERVAARRLGKNWIWYILVALPFIAFFGWAFGARPISAALDLFGPSGLVLVAITALVAIAWFIAESEKAAGRHESNYRYHLAFYQFLMLLLSFQAGTLWIDYLRTDAPRVTAEVADWENTRTISIAMPGTEGILAFVDDDPMVTYIPWSRIVELKARQPEEPSATTPTPSDTVSGTNEQ